MVTGPTNMTNRDPCHFLRALIMGYTIVKWVLDWNVVYLMKMKIIRSFQNEEFASKEVFFKVY